MKTIFKWIRITVGSLLGILLLALALIYVSSGITVNKTYEVAASPITLPTDSASLAEGKRLALIRGCYNGCHGKALDGSVFFDEPGFARVVAPNLTRIAKDYSDEELARVIRHGVRPDDKSVLVMPSSMYYHLSDADLGAIIAYIRSVPQTEGPPTEVHLGPGARLAFVMGEFAPQAAEIDHTAPRLGETSLTDSLVLGEYIAQTACTECHGLDLRGDKSGSPPDLIITAGYSLLDFERLMRTGVALGDRELDLMALVAQKRFSHLTQGEVRALHAYLNTLGA